MSASRAVETTEHDVFVEIVAAATFRVVDRAVRRVLVGAFVLWAVLLVLALVLGTGGAVVIGAAPVVPIVLYFLVVVPLRRAVVRLSRAVGSWHR